MKRIMVCNSDPYGDVMDNCKALWTLLRGSLMHMLDPLYVSK
jgi:hypothetical protein